MNSPISIRAYKPRIDLLQDRVILVTGANRGIGRAVARDLARHGAIVILHGRDAKALDALHGELSALGPEPAVAVLDLEHAQGEAYRDLTSQLESRYGKLDGLLHNAGILGDRSPVEHYDIDVWQRVMHVNFNAAFILTRCLLPLMHRSDDASVVFTTSGVGNRGRSYWGAYCCSKFATEGLTQTLADELENTGIRVNCIDPGAVRTAMRQAAYPAEDPRTLPTPESLTGAYVYLLGPDSRQVHGERIRARP
ncbi:MAG: YciK family oxidoreductase [Rhodospirillaceae bacterium]|nr:YciK family oxidoreductase [Rhodospirillaceae bacterium]